MKTTLIGIFCIIVLAVAGYAGQSTASIFYSSFEIPDSTGKVPEGWRAVAKGKSILDWESGGYDGKHCVSITQYHKKDTAYWESENISVKPNTAYIISLWYRLEDKYEGPCEVLVDGNDFYLPVFNKWSKWQKKFKTREHTHNIKIKLWMNYRVEQRVSFDKVAFVQADLLPNPTEPENNSILRNNKPTLRWQSIPGITRYSVCLSHEQKLYKVVCDAPDYTPEVPLERGTWFWKVMPFVKEKKKETALFEASKTNSFLIVGKNYFKQADTTPPWIYGVRPPPDTSVNTSQPIIEAMCRDAGERKLGRDFITFYLDGEMCSHFKFNISGLITLEVKEPLTKGKHTVRIVASDSCNNKAEVKWNFYVNQKAPSVCSFNDDLITIFNGQPMFPIGIYSYAHGKHLDELVMAGFNTILSESIGSKNYLKKLLSHGLKILLQARKPIIESKNQIELYENFIKIGPHALRNHPALLGYWTDEIEGSKYEPKFIQLAHHIACIIDSNHPLAACLYSPKDYVPFGATADVLFPDIYPVPNHPLTKISDYLNEAIKVAQETKQPAWVILQAFDWTVAAKGELAPGKEYRPIGEEMRCMTYLALIHGAKGIFYWASDSGRCDIVNFPERWQALKGIASELRALTPALVSLSPNISLEMIPKDAPIHAVVRQFPDGHLIIIAVNPGRIPYEVTFRSHTLHSGQTVKVLFEDRVGKVMSNEFTDVFPGLAVHVYKVLPVSE